MAAHNELSEVLSTYFRGIYVGDVSALKRIFHPRAELFGEVKGQPYQKTLLEYLAGVASRESPSQLGEQFSMKTIFLDVVGSIAVAKVSCPMLGYNYIDYLTIVRVDGMWLIVGKTLTHVECGQASVPALQKAP